MKMYSTTIFLLLCCALSAVGQPRSSMTMEEFRYRELVQRTPWGACDISALAVGLAETASARVQNGTETDMQENWRQACRMAAVAYVLSPREAAVAVPYTQLMNLKAPAAVTPRVEDSELSKQLLAASGKVPDLEGLNREFKALLTDLAVTLDPENTQAIMAQVDLDQEGVKPNWLNFDYKLRVMESPHSGLYRSRYGSGGMPHSPGTPYGERTPANRTEESKEDKKEEKKVAALPEPDQESKTSWNGTSSAKIQVLMVRESSSGAPSIGLVNDLILTVDTGLKRTGVHAKFNQEVGDDMETALQEAVRLAKVRRKGAEEGVSAVLGFQDKYTSKDGGSAGTACALLLCSVLEGFGIDPTFALTGDITADGLVRKVGGIHHKLDGAVKRGARFVAIPEENREVVDDLVLLMGMESLLRTNLFSIKTLDDAVLVAAADKAPEYLRAVELYEGVARDLQARKPGRGLRSPEVLQELQQVVEVLPNHLGAWYLLRHARGQTGEKFSQTFSAELIFERSQRFLPSIFNEEIDQYAQGRDVVVNSTIPRETCEAAYRDLNELNFKVDSRSGELLSEMIRYVEVWKKISEIPGANNNSPTMRQRREELMQVRARVIDKISEMSFDRHYLEELIQE